jgi:SAM-dependent methyltransferase
MKRWMAVLGIVFLWSPLVRAEDPARLSNAVGDPTVLSKGQPDEDASCGTGIDLTDSSISSTCAADPPPKMSLVNLPTPESVVEKMLELAKVTKDDVVYDLGCGDGRIPVTAARKYGCRAYGCDIDPQRVKESLENVAKSKVGDLVTIEQRDIFTLDLRGASVVTLYLLPKMNVKLIPQLDKLKPGARIVLAQFRHSGRHAGSGRRDDHTERGQAPHLSLDNAFEEGAALAAPQARSGPGGSGAAYIDDIQLQYPPAP